MASKPDSNPKPAATWSETDVYHLIVECDDFIVFLDSGLDVDWQTFPKYDQHGPKDPGKHNKILIRAAALECIPNDHHRTNVRLNFKRMIAEGIARSLDHDYDSANKSLNEAESYITARNVETARFWQLSTGCVIGLAVAVAGTVI